MGIKKWIGKAIDRVDSVSIGPAKIGLQGHVEKERERARQEAIAEERERARQEAIADQKEREKVRIHWDVDGETDYYES